jgi:hypothetical protein
MAYSRRNSGLKFYVDGQRAKSLHGLVDPLDRTLSAYETATVRAVSSLKRRAEPAAKRVVRSLYNVKAGDLSGKFRIEDGVSGRGGDRSGFISIWASTRRMPLIAFGGRWGGRKTPGATAAITSDASKTYGSSFIATVRGLRSIRVRQFVGGKRAGRGPLRILRGPSPFEMISGLDHHASRDVKSGIVTELRAFYLGELRRQWKLARGGNG